MHLKMPIVRASLLQRLRSAQDALPAGPLQLARLLHGRIALQSAEDEEPQDQDKRYVDRLKLVAQSGGGGHGCVSFWRGAGRGELLAAGCSQHSYERQAWFQVTACVLAVSAAAACPTRAAAPCCREAGAG